MATANAATSQRIDAKPESNFKYPFFSWLAMAILGGWIGWHAGLSVFTGVGMAVLLWISLMNLGWTLLLIYEERQDERRGK